MSSKKKRNKTVSTPTSRTVRLPVSDGGPINAKTRTSRAFRTGGAGTGGGIGGGRDSTLLSSYLKEIVGSIGKLGA